MADLEGFATLAAVMVTNSEDVMVPGAVYNPSDKVPNRGSRDHVTPVFWLPVTVAVNCVAVDGVRDAVDGSKLTLTASATS